MAILPNKLMRIDNQKVQDVYIQFGGYIEWEPKNIKWGIISEKQLDDQQLEKQQSKDYNHATETTQKDNAEFTISNIGPVEESNEYVPNEEDLLIRGGADSEISWEDPMEFNPEVEFRKPKFDLVVGKKFKNFRVFREVLCFSKGPFGGQLLSAIGRDENDNMYPIAFTIVEVEMYDSWRWFLNELKTNIGIDDGVRWTFISNRQKGLVRALEEEVPGAENRNVDGRSHGRRNFNVASFATRGANSAGMASGSRKRIVRRRGVTAANARKKGNETSMVKVAGWDGMRRSAVAGMVSKGSAGTSSAFGTDTGSFATPVGSTQQGTGKPPVGSA
ncbi:hypothetical protein ACH5RR_000216 [Cinchona calisaya]|uniref:MULE transposase domain-containing protein n=1 Tax=Cinchona calisaya TaxID=153742 RepID=A0ABD3B022_9GENT